MQVPTDVNLQRPGNGQKTHFFTYWRPSICEISKFEVFQKKRNRSPDTLHNDVTSCQKSEETNDAFSSKCWITLHWFLRSYCVIIFVLCTALITQRRDAHYRNNKKVHIVRRWHWNPNTKLTTSLHWFLRSYCVIISVLWTALITLRRDAHYRNNKKGHKTMTLKPNTTPTTLLEHSNIITSRGQRVEKRLC